jgi:hypothetical protein
MGWREKARCLPARQNDAIGPSVWTGRALNPKVMIWKVGLAHLYPIFLMEPLTPGHHGYPRVRSHSGLGPEGQKGHLITNALARAFSISSFRLARSLAVTE